MKHRACLHWFGISCLVVASCTQLRDPNQIFIAANQGGSLAAGDGNEAGGAGLADSFGGNAGTANGGGASNGGSNNSGDSGAPDADCQDDTGFNGLGCYRCAPKDIFTLENACTGAVCTPFDNQRLSALGADGKLPALPTSPGSGGAGGAGGVASAAGSGGASGSAGAGGTTGTGKPCADVGKQGGTIVYVTGSSAAQPMLREIARQLAPLNLFIVYESSGSCVGVDAIVNGTPMTTGPTAPAPSATYWDSLTSVGTACDLPAEGVSADIGASDVFAQTCPGFESANLDARQVRDSHGPIQTMTFAVPATSIYNEISAEAAYFVFGFGAAGGVRDASGGAHTIWNDEDYIFKRSASSGTQAMLAAAIGVPAGAWKGKAHKASGDVTGDLQLAGQKQDTANLAIGIVASDYIESNALQGSVKVLAFQDTGQRCAVYPGSTRSARDKQNVRDGHYPMWSPLHLLVRVDSLGNPINPANRQAVTDILGYLSGTKALPSGTPLIGFYAASGLIPECAMHVTRTKDGGDILPYQPSNPCSCLFDELESTTTCTRCQVQGNCKSGETCSQGYCEPQ
jgi:hypothetical protein